MKEGETDEACRVNQKHNCDSLRQNPVKASLFDTHIFFCHFLAPRKNQPEIDLREFNNFYSLTGRRSEKGGAPKWPPPSLEGIFFAGILPSKSIPTSARIA
jgi:hypothetical protein